MPASKKVAYGSKKTKSKDVMLKQMLAKKQGKGLDKKSAKATEKEKCRQKVEEIAKQAKLTSKKKDASKQKDVSEKEAKIPKSKPKAEVTEREGALKRKAESESSCPKTPPTKRVHFKSPVVNGEKGTDDALLKILKKSELCAELDGAGMSAFLEYIKEKHPDCTAQEALCHMAAKKDLVLKNPKKEMEKTLRDAIFAAKQAQALAEASAEEEDAEDQDGDDDNDSAEEEDSGEEAEEPSPAGEEASGSEEDGEAAEETESEEEEHEEADDEEEPAVPNNENKGALVAAVQGTEANAAQVRNSTTHKADWDQFMRQVTARKVFPKKLTGEFKASKTDLFNVWMDSGKSWQKTELMVERKQSSKVLSRKDMEAVKAKKIIEEYGEEKGKALIKRRRECGLYYDDEDWPSDELETWIYMPKGRLLRAEDSFTESMSGKAKLDDKQAFDALTGADGPLASGSLPEIKAATEAGQKKLYQIMDEEGKAVTKKPKTPKNVENSVEEVVPKTPQE